MEPYTTTIENILPGMIVRATDIEYGSTVVVRVVHTCTDEDGSACIRAEKIDVDVRDDSEITVLHDPTRIPADHAGKGA